MSGEWPHRVLVIKHGALGDFVLTTGPFAAIRRHHADAHVTLLTTAPFADIARASGWFDAVWVDHRPVWWQLGAWAALRRRLRGGRFDWVYDLQTSDRTGVYFRLLGPGARPHWSGIAPGCSHPDPDPDRDARHTLDRQRGQLRAAGIDAVPDPDLTWLDGDLTAADPPAPYAVIAPGGSAHRQDKRWPAGHFAALARALAADGVTPVLIGSVGEAPVLAEIARAEPRAVDLCGTTRIADIAGLARGAALAVGNDTGPMHVAAACACPCLVLFSAASDPALCAPRGAHVTILRRDRLADLAPETVIDAARAAIAGAARRAG